MQHLRTLQTTGLILVMSLYWNNTKLRILLPLHTAPSDWERNALCWWLPGPVSSAQRILGDKLLKGAVAGCMPGHCGHHRRLLRRGILAPV